MNGWGLPSTGFSFSQPPQPPQSSAQSFARQLQTSPYGMQPPIYQTPFQTYFGVAPAYYLPPAPAAYPYGGSNPYAGSFTSDEIQARLNAMRALYPTPQNQAFDQRQHFADLNRKREAAYLNRVQNFNRYL
jgi:hypothetical protein